MRQTVRALARLKDFCGVISGAIIPIFVGLLCDSRKELIALSPFAFYIPIVFCIVFAIFFSINNFYIKSSAEILAELDELTQKLKGFDVAVGVFTTVDLLCTAWRKFVDASVNNPKLEDVKLIEAISAMCGLIVYRKDDIYHFRPTELWSFGVYKFDTMTNTLLCVWREKATSHPGNSEGRPWQPGQGHVGITFSNRSGKTTLDARVPAVRELLQAPTGLTREYDGKVYVSLQTEPILVTEDGQPWGVIVGTSNLPGRFNGSNGMALNHLASEIASLITTNAARLPVG
ncbi:MAG: hypothetical protein ACRYG6_13620 [Janthinobacterium lividum]